MDKETQELIEMIISTPLVRSDKCEKCESICCSYCSVRFPEIKANKTELQKYVEKILDDAVNNSK